MEGHIEIYCDGACSGNPGPGGWGSILLWKQDMKEISGFEALTTNNRMEMTAAIKALETVKREIKIKIYTDSIYLQKGMTEWLASWKRNGWKGGKIKNIDLWQELDKLNAKHQIDWYWVKGHADSKYNNRADFLARSQIKNRC